MIGLIIILIWFISAKRFLSKIIENGLLPMSRQHVHLSDSENTALKVGQRHGKPIVLTIDSGKMFKDGIHFFLSENNVWLTETVPVGYIRFNDLGNL